MNIQFNFLRALLFVLIACSSVFGQAEAKRQIDPGVAQLGKGFVSKTAQVHGTTLHYVRGGTGPAVILLHRFPQDWYEFHQIMPRLTKKFTVIAVDLRGVGGSAATPVAAGSLAPACVPCMRSCSGVKVSCPGVRGAAGQGKRKGVTARGRLKEAWNEGAGQPVRELLSHNDSDPTHVLLIGVSEDNQLHSYLYTLQSSGTLRLTGMSQLLSALL